MTKKLPWLLVSSAVGIGFGYATLGTLSIIGSTRLGLTFWWLEPLIAIVVGILSFTLCQKVATQQQNQPITHRGERAIWRLAYRKGWEVTLEQILQETMLEESAALTALQELERKGQAKLLESNRWLLQG